MEQNQQNKPAENKTSGAPKKRFIIPLIIIVVVIAAGAFIYFSVSTTNSNTNSSTNSATQKISNQTAADSWIEYNATAGQFKIKLPKNPELDSSDLQVPDTNIVYTEHDYYVEGDDNTAYFVSTAIMPESVDISDPNKNLEGSVNGSVQSDEGNTLVSLNFTTYKGNPAVDYVIDNSVGGVTMHCRSVLIGRQLFALVASYEIDSFNATDFNKFVNSLELL